MKLVSLNIWGGRLHGPLIDFIKDKKDEVDIFCFQEVYLDAEGKEKKYVDDALNIFKEFEEILTDHNGYFRPAVDDYYGLATFVRKDLNVKEEGEIFVYEGEGDSEDDDYAYKTHPRNLHYISLNNGSSDYFVAQFHGLWTGSGKLDTEDRINQSKKALEFLEKRDESKKILCGDFNLLPETESIKILETKFENLIKTHGVKSTRSSHYVKEDKFADYVFVSKDLDVKNFEVLRDEVSDHLPLYVDFS